MSPALKSLVTKMSPPYDKNVVTPYDKNVTHNNITKNNTNNIKRARDVFAKYDDQEILASGVSDEELSNILEDIKIE